MKPMAFAVFLVLALLAALEAKSVDLQGKPSIETHGVLFSEVDQNINSF